MSVFRSVRYTLLKQRYDILFLLKNRSPLLKFVA
jgi:hypothetical protein